MNSVHLNAKYKHKIGRSKQGKADVLWENVKRRHYNIYYHTNNLIKTSQT